MDSKVFALHPNPGWSGSDHVEAPECNLMFGKHCILELYECDVLKLNDEAFIRTTITLASKVSGAKILNLITYRFHPQGVTGLALLAESHISIHTWPESRYAAIDVFTCGTNTIPEKACDFLKKEFFAKRFSLQTIRRQTPDQLSNHSRKTS